jgi:hypothetical protein
MIWMSHEEMHLALRIAIERLGELDLAAATGDEKSIEFLNKVHMTTGRSPKRIRNSWLECDRALEQHNRTLLNDSGELRPNTPQPWLDIKVRFLVRGRYG